jgi:hypothetical protein
VVCALKRHKLSRLCQWFSGFQNLVLSAFVVLVQVLHKAIQVSEFGSKCFCRAHTCLLRVLNPSSFLTNDETSKVSGFCSAHTCFTM